MRFEGQIAIVTGGAAGIGLATATRLLDEGASVVIADLREPEGEGATLLERGARFERCDVTSAADAERLVAGVVEQAGRIDVLVAGAGVAGSGTVLETSEAEWDRVMSVNLKGAFLCCRAAIDQMKHQGAGSIVIVASEEGLIGGPGAAAYCASKGGVIQLTRAMAVDHAEDGIRINCVCPGPIRTQLLMDFYDADADPDESARTAARHTLLRRCGEPHEIAAMIAFAASPEATYLVGSVLVADGGVTAQ